MKIACLTEGKRVHSVCASITSPASSHMTVWSSNWFSIEEFMAQAVIVIAITSSGISIQPEKHVLLAGFAYDLEDIEHQCHDKPETVSRRQLDADDESQLCGQVWFEDQSLLSIC